MIGDLVLLNGTYYLQANRNGTLVKVGVCIKIPFYKKFWLEFRDKFKKWDFNEALQFVQGHSKTTSTSKADFVYFWDVVGHSRRKYD